MLVYWLDIVGTAVFAISGVLLAGKLRMDPFGVLVLGVVTAVGGGTIRDMALDNGPVFWVKDPTDLVVAMVTSMLTILLVRQPRRLPKWMLPVLDAVGLAVFVGIGVNKAFLAETGPLVAVCMGVITGVGGGIIRDVLAREIPMILRTEIYATACIIGGIVHATAFYTFSVPLESASMMGMVVTLFIRLAAIRWHLKLPTFALDENGRLILFLPDGATLIGPGTSSCRPDKTLASPSGTTNNNQMLKEEPHPQVLFRIRVGYNEAGTFQAFGIIDRTTHQILQTHRVNHQANALFFDGSYPLR
ncbi:inner membrane protein YadS [Salmonella enterica subsp. enterica]|nr:inner membrane protein YadS [Salmonella enterica subsp. enterica]